MKDRFSAHANQYAQFRPAYPPELYEFIYRHVLDFEAAWDCGTGNGQAARDLSKKFKKVFATDISAKQLENAYQAGNIFYSIANEKSSFADNSFDLITVAQAAHWFNMEEFSKEAKRVAKPNSVIALWGYGLLTINPEIDGLLNYFYTQVVGAYWDKERRHIDEQYKNLYFPFEEIQSPAFTLSISWTLAELIGYVSTWSAVQKYISVNNQNPIENWKSEIENFWKEPTQAVRFPLFLRLGRVIPLPIMN
jgi:Methyltransferase domain